MLMSVFNVEKLIFFFLFFFFRFSKSDVIDCLGWNSVFFGPWGLCAFFARTNPKGIGSWSILLKETILPEFRCYSRIRIRSVSK